ncbi:NAD-dependent epimerase/dehydratase family protein [Lactobacillus delbrueckii]|uniref:NAD-dependent epimerase/dehydratase family protein n=1 Tax=Lactobacillus delbrueckii TaxID=1584 RepID=UPI000682EB9C|nr:NAD-dependent epimerase/dehydratase family protein [Lactobacillus delbrueckii]APP03578.1 epimerase [Lactobacillus delbrueckii subsp. indicus]KNE30003.1 epimerase [Lactobacillus delbrueckii subsp. indicus]KRL75841.1 NAD dependent epimerase dehydratase family protein [Lactobacillus delbrueckii subsp. indicus DSM 15996]
MKSVIIGGAGFIGTNLAIHLARETEGQITIIDREDYYFDTLKSLNLPRITYKAAPFSMDADFDEQVKGQDVVYHLASTVIPGTSNQNVPAELEANIIVTAKLLDACVRQEVKKVVFISSGGAVYGKKGTCPIPEDTVTYPISSYGIQKLAIEKLLYLYHYQENLDYRVIRLANPYGPYQRPNGKLGVVTTFVYKALTDGKLVVYGDGSVVRDFIYIEDAVRAINKIVNGNSDLRIFNLGSGRGTSVNELISDIKESIASELEVEHIATRAADVLVNYLDISRYEANYGKLNPVSLKDGILKTAQFMKETGMVK